MKLILLSLLAISSFTPPAMADLTPLRACAYAFSKNIEGLRITEGWSSDDENSFFFLNCNDNYDLGQDHYVFTPNGIYYFFIKPHKDYKGGAEGTQFRLSLENKIYYFKSNIVGGMGDLFDQSGIPMSSNGIDSENPNYDISSKNPVLNHYMKVITGKSDPKSAVMAEPATGERLLKAQSCIQERIQKLSSSLVRVYKHRRDHRQVDQETLDRYLKATETALRTNECYTDAVISTTFTDLLDQLQK